MHRRCKIDSVMFFNLRGLSMRELDPALTNGNDYRSLRRCALGAGDVASRFEGREGEGILEVALFVCVDYPMAGALTRIERGKSPFASQPQKS